MSDHPPATEQQIRKAMLLAIAVRNELEALHGGDLTSDEIGCEPLTDEQMRMINPIVRNSVLSVLHALDNYVEDDRARLYIGFQESLVPDYWECPVLTEDYLSVYERPATTVQCRRCGRGVVQDGNRWTHLAADGGLSIGCRAASFTDDDGWDESLDPNWKAQPSSGSPGAGRSTP